QICHAGLEAICFQLRAIIELIAGSGESIDRLRVDGGPARSPYLMQLQADILQRPLAVAAIDSLTSYGAALMGGLGAGLWTDLGALRQVVGPAAVVRPDATRAAAWDAAYRQWRATTEAVLGLSGSGGGG